MNDKNTTIYSKRNIKHKILTITTPYINNIHRTINGKKPHTPKLNTKHLTKKYIMHNTQPFRNAKHQNIKTKNIKKQHIYIYMKNKSKIKNLHNITQNILLKSGDIELNP